VVDAEGLDRLQRGAGDRIGLRQEQRAVDRTGEVVAGEGVGELVLADDDGFARAAGEGLPGDLRSGGGPVGTEDAGDGELGQGLRRPCGHHGRSGGEAAEGEERRQAPPLGGSDHADVPLLH
jgi:hypothetical protein